MPTRRRPSLAPFNGLSLLALLLLALLLALAAGPARAAGAADAEGARVIVKYKALGRLMRESATTGGAPQHAAALGRRVGLSLSDGRAIDGRTQVLRARGLSSQQLAAQLAADDEVEYAVPDQRRRALAVPNDPLFAASSLISPAAGQWYLRAPDATRVSAINAAGAWDVTAGMPSLVVAVVDTGVRFDHPDLAGQLVGGYDFIADSTESRDGNGRDADPSDPGDWTIDNQCGPGEEAATSSWHGTQMAGLVAARANNGIGMAGTAHGVRVVPVRVLSACGGFDSDILAGMLWAGGVSSQPVVNPNPARVINVSLGSTGSCNAAYRDVVAQLVAAGVVVVAAAGNEEGLAVGVPANCPGTIAVAGLRHAGSKVGFSSLGPEVAISAPGGNCVNLSGECLYPILTTTNTGAQAPGAHSYSDGSNASYGTSFATPLVAATAALMLSANPALSPAQVRSLLQGSARPFPTTTGDPTVPQCRAPTTEAQDECLCTTSTCGAGMLDATAAVRAAAASAAPSVSIRGAADAVLAGTALSLDGSATTVAAGRSITGWRWTLTTGGAIAALVGDASGPTVQVRTTGVGSFTVQLTVTDSLGAQASASRSITVNAPAAPVVNLLASANVVSAGSELSFDASGSTAASGLAIAAYQWTLVAGGDLAAITAGANEALVRITTRGGSGGTVTVQVTVTDSLGQSASASRSVTVTPQGPSASIQASAATVAVGGSVGLDGGGSTAPSGRQVVGWQWSISSGQGLATLAGGTSGPTATLQGVAAGSVTVTLTVTDSAGAQDSRSTTITVQAAGGGNAGSSARGGGAMGGLWLLGLALAVLALRPRRR